jgi:hypothetical protein
MADMMMAMAGWVSLGSCHGPVIVAAVVPVLRCGVFSDEVQGWGHFMCLPHEYSTTQGLFTPNNPFTSHLDGEEVSMCHVSL